MNKIAIIEDDIDICNMIAKFLENNKYIVHYALNGAEGIELCKSLVPDLIILDIMLPKLNGNDVLQRLRKFTNAPVIVVSAKTMVQTKIDLLKLGADDYMTKPFSPSELVARVKAHLSRYERLVNSAQPENDIIEIRGIRIDKTARRVFVNGEEKIFTTKEFDLLTFLAEHPNHVYTKEELFKEIHFVLNAYIRGQLLLSTLMAVVVFIGMWTLNIPYPLVIGLLAGIVEMVPLIGPIIGAIPPVLLGLLQGTTVMLQVIFFYIIVQQVDGHFVMPKLMGSIINVHPVAIIAGVLIGGKIFGVLGMMIAVPLVAVLQILLKHMWFYDRYKKVR